MSTVIVTVQNTTAAVETAKTVGTGNDGCCCIMVRNEVELIRIGMFG